MAEWVWWPMIAVALDGALFLGLVGLLAKERNWVTLIELGAVAGVCGFLWLLLYGLAHVIK